MAAAGVHEAGLSPREAGTELTPTLRSASSGGLPSPAPANKQQRAACSAAEQLLPMNTQVAATGRARLAFLGWGYK